MANLALYLGLGLTYFADYCSLIGLMELAKSFGSLSDVVSVFVINGLPGVLLLITGRLWSHAHTSPRVQMVYLVLAAGLVASTLLSLQGLVHILAVTFLHGLVKGAIKAITATYIKGNVPESNQARVMGHTVTIRFTIMIIGGSLGAYLGEQQSFGLMIGLIAGAYLLASASFLFLASQPNRSAESREPEADETTSSDLGDFFVGFGKVPFVAYLTSCLGLGLFMSLEYPLFTLDLQVKPSQMFIIWGGHLVGALLADRALHALLKKWSRQKAVYVFSLVQLLIFMSIGLLGSRITVLTVQILVAASIMVALETSANLHLMQRSTQSAFRLRAIYLNGFYVIGMFAGSLLALPALDSFSLIQVNQLIHVPLISVVVFSMVLASVVQRSTPKEVYDDQ